ncbi:MAG: hypothetical protein WCK67_08775 [bacterium]
MKLTNSTFSAPIQTRNIQRTQANDSIKTNEVKFKGSVKEECVIIADFLADCAHSYGKDWCKTAKNIINESGNKTPEKDKLIGFFDAIGKVPSFLIKGKNHVEKIANITETLKVVPDQEIKERLTFMSERLKERSTDSKPSKTIEEWKTYFKK